MKILGIDPGTQNLGWGFISTDSKRNINKVEFGVLKAPARLNFYERLEFFDSEIHKICEAYSPDFAVIEKIFLGKNVDSAFKLGHIRGVCAARCVAAGSQVQEIAARTVKKAITGSGAADKMVVQNFLFQQLNIRTDMKSLDASDALALAFCGLLQDSVKSKNKSLGLI